MKNRNLTKNILATATDGMKQDIESDAEYLTRVVGRKVGQSEVIQLLIAYAHPARRDEVDPVALNAMIDRINALALDRQ